MFIFFILAVAYAEPEDVVCAEGFNCTLDADTGEFKITGTGAMPDYTSATEQPWSGKRASIQIVTIGEGITSIGNYSFNQATSLRQVTLSSTIETIGQWAFGNCNQLGTINFEAATALTTIEPHAFQGINNQNNALDLILPANVKTIESNAFGSAKIKSVTMKGVDTIGERAFGYSSHLTSVVIESCPTYIDFSAFGDTSNLEKIEMTKTDCTNYSTDEGILLFKNTTDVEIMRYPPKKVKRDYFPNGVTIVCERCYDDAAMTEITLPSTLRIIRKWAFRKNNFETLVFNENLQIIEEGAFQSCSQLKTVKLCSTLTTLGENVFSSCNNLEKFEPSATPGSILAENGILYTNSKKILLRSPPKNAFTDGKFSNDDNLEIIYVGAFQSNENLKTVELKGNLHTIHQQAFASCNALKTVTISTPLLESIGENLFQNDAELETVTLGDGVEMIGSSMFSGCKKLSSVTLGTKIFTIESSAFSGTAITSIVIPDSCKYIKYSAFQNCIELKTVTIGNSAIEITENAFYGCEKLETVTFTDGSKLVRIDTGAFRGTKLSSVEIPPSVLIVDDNSFGDCESLTTITYKGPQQPAYCSPSAFDGSPVKKVNLVENYPQQEFCGLRVEPPKPSEPSNGNKDNGSTLMTIVLSVILAFLIF